MQIEALQNRIESTTASLPQAVQSSHGADFALLISLLDTYQQNTPYQPLQGTKTQSGDEVFTLPESRYLSLDETQPAAVIERLNQAVNENRPADFAYLNSLIATRAETATSAPVPTDDFAKMALIASGSLMLDQINASQQSIAR